MAVDVDFDSHFDRVYATLSGAAMDGLVDAAEHLLQVSRTEVPHEQGDLERSGAVTQDRTQDTVAVSYDRPYAVIQHEELSYRHAPGRKAKYLEDPAIAERETMTAIAAKRVRRAMRSG